MALLHSHQSSFATYATLAALPEPNKSGNFAGMQAAVLDAGEGDDVIYILAPANADAPADAGLRWVAYGVEPGPYYT